jgi:hypothetical protein
LLVTVILPPVQPFADGVNVTFKTRVCPALSVAGRLVPGTLNSDPLTLMAEIVALLVPVLVRINS